MRVYVLHFDSVGSLTRAFDRLLSCHAVASCTVEPERARILFLAPAGTARPLLERFYLEGGLVWCSGHPVAQPPPAAGGPRRVS